MEKTIKGSITSECWVYLTVNEQINPTSIPINAPPNITVNKLAKAKMYWES